MNTLRAAIMVLVVEIFAIGIIGFPPVIAKKFSISCALNLYVHNNYKVLLVGTPSWCRPYMMLAVAPHP